MRCLSLLILLLPVTGSAQMPDSSRLALLEHTPTLIAAAPDTALPVAVLVRPVSPTFVDIENVWEPDSEAAALSADSVRMSLPPDSSTYVRVAPDSDWNELQQLSSDARYGLGRNDARVYYRPSKAIFWGSFGAGLVLSVALAGAGPLVLASPLVGLGGAAIIKKQPIPQARLEARAPKPTLLRDPDYRRGYAEAAQRKKFGSSIGGYGAGLGTFLVASIALVIYIIATYGFF